MRVAILQSNYIPWRGYFDIIGSVDLFLFLDDRQYTKQDWRNRNRIKTPNGAEWLTIPCGSDLKRRINQVRVDTRPWQQAHWHRIEQCYGRAPYWRQYRDLLASFYLGQSWTHLSDLNQSIIQTLSREIFQFPTRFGRAEDLGAEGVRDGYVLDLCRRAGATTYLSGPAARAYLDEGMFRDAGIAVRWMDYSGYPDYPQLWGPFIPDVSVVDLILNTGPHARDALVRTSP